MFLRQSDAAPRGKYRAKRSTTLSRPFRKCGSGHVDVVSAIFPISSHYRVGVFGEVALGRPTLGQVAFPMDGLVALCVSRRRSLRRMTLLSHQRNFVMFLRQSDAAPRGKYSFYLHSAVLRGGMVQCRAAPSRPRTLLKRLRREDGRCLRLQGVCLHALTVAGFPWR